MSDKLSETSTETIIAALRAIASGGIHDEEGVTTAAITEAADRLEELEAEREVMTRWRKQEKVTANINNNV